MRYKPTLASSAKISALWNNIVTTKMIEVGITNASRNHADARLI